MKQYIIKRVALKDAEHEMNKMARKDWKVVSTNLVVVDIGYSLFDLIITFEKEA